MSIGAQIRSMGVITSIFSGIEGIYYVDFKVWKRI